MNLVNHAADNEFCKYVHQKTGHVSWFTWGVEAFCSKANAKHGWKRCQREPCSWHAWAYKNQNWNVTSLEWGKWFSSQSIHGQNLVARRPQDPSGQPAASPNNSMEQQSALVCWRGCLPRKNRRIATASWPHVLAQAPTNTKRPRPISVQNIKHASLRGPSYCSSRLPATCDQSMSINGSLD